MKKNVLYTINTALPVLKVWVAELVPVVLSILTPSTTSQISSGVPAAASPISLILFSAEVLEAVHAVQEAAVPPPVQVSAMIFIFSSRTLFTVPRLIFILSTTRPVKPVRVAVLLPVLLKRLVLPVTVWARFVRVTASLLFSRLVQSAAVKVQQSISLVQAAVELVFRKNQSRCLLRFQPELITESVS